MRRGDRGAVALETALVVVVLLGLCGFVAPLPYAFYEKVQLERATARAVRFASSRPTVDREAVNGTLVRAGFRPSRGQVEAEAADAYDATGRGRVVAVDVVTAAAATCPTLFETTVRMRATIDLGPAYALVDAAGFPVPRTLQLRAEATNCRE